MIVSIITINHYRHHHHPVGTTLGLRPEMQRPKREAESKNASSSISTPVYGFMA
jgi:hypothetical protein